MVRFEERQHLRQRWMWLLIRYVPFTSRRIRLTEILGVIARKYDAVREYGGPGVKGCSRDKRAYNVVTGYTWRGPSRPAAGRRP